uniref:Endophilin-B1-like n=1 Tax=Cyprinodon variegatus TaxID=28743 RepID=A0A3Q2DCE1_CYPVA
MDLTRLAVDAGQFINRAVQYTGEILGHTGRTELDPELETLLARADATKTWTDSIISQTEVLLQPSLARLEDRLYEHLEWNAPTRPRAHEVLGEQMTQAGLEIGSNTPYGKCCHRDEVSWTGTVPTNDLRLCEQAEMELRICQSLFDRQSEIMSRSLAGIGNTHVC